MFATIKSRMIRLGNFLIFNYLDCAIERPISLIINILVATAIVYALAFMGITGFIGALLGAIINISLKRAVLLFCLNRSCAYA